MTSEILPSHENQIKIAENNILLVGAGGLGCELLKLLVMTGFKKISVIDMDKIEKSNLNRQFLFNRESLGKYKSEMAVQSVMKFRKDPMLELKAYVGNIKDTSKFPDKFFQQFSLVLNALDNIDTRYYINRICMKLKIPLINSGTEGFLGSVSCHLEGETPCYSCRKKIEQKTIPICSIRLKPEKMEHCVAWGKSIFDKLFCNFSGNTKKEEKGDLEDYDFLDKNGDPIIIMNRLFNLEIKDLKKLAQETEQSFKILKPIDLLQIFENIENFKAKSKEIYESFSNDVSLWYNTPTSADISSFLCIFYQTFNELAKSSQDKRLEFDKENDTIISFIYSSSNLRAANFAIPFCSKFNLKQIAGNIVPAIASTNNIIASIQVMEAIKLVLNKKDQMKNVNLKIDKSIKSSFANKEERNSNCPTCSKLSLKALRVEEIVLSVPFKTTSINTIVERTMKEGKVDIPTYLQVEVGGSLLYEEGENTDDDEVEYYKTIKSRVISSFTSWEKPILLNFIFHYGDDEEKIKYLKVGLNNTEEKDENDEKVIGQKREREKEDNKKNN